ncbi:MAG TPA: DUF6514 family protein, partial [Oscillospiraceae bacterium]|nr:DUF6514 family protein [Oscillospiraceae bacterium]
RTVEGEEYTLRCYLLTEEIYAGARLRAERYGVRLELLRGGATEAAEAAALTMSGAAAAGLMETLVSGGVTPAALPDVISDWQHAEYLDCYRNVT